jgi:hypothetical protein
MNTPTPRTHAVVVLCNYGKERVTADFARTLERELAVAQNWVEHHSQHADDLIAQNVELRAKVERLKKQIKDDNRSYGCELRDPNGTIWEQATKDRARAERAEAELAKERARLDAVIYDCWVIHKGNENAYAVRSLGEYITHWVATPRAAIDAAMKEGAK